MTVEQQVAYMADRRTAFVFLHAGRPKICPRHLSGDVTEVKHRPSRIFKEKVARGGRTRAQRYEPYLTLSHMLCIYILKEE